MKVSRLFLICAIFMFAISTGISALTIKMGTLVPNGSPWEKNLKKLAADWARISNGRVQLKIFAGGRAGDEPDMLRKMRFNQLQAAGLSVSGLSQIFGGVLAPAIPLLVENFEELDYVLKKMRPTFEKEFEKKGFKILFWSKAGWARFFSRDPIVTPQDLKNQKLWIMEGNDEEANTWKRLGYKTARFATMDMMVQLQTGGVDVFVSNPLIAASNQWFGVANNMSDLNWAPLYGAFIITTRTWNRIPEELHSALIEAGEQCGFQMDQETINADDEAVDIMLKYGLVINKTTEDSRKEWELFVDKASRLLIGQKFEFELYYEAKKHVDDFRRLNGR
jgi:TRAP-type C4-dicarboxylate transport system substrate-binding protein